MNDDLISRSALLKDVRICKEAVSACANHDYMVGYASALSGVEGQIAAAPAVDAEPVRHGRLASTGFDEIYCEWGDCTVCGSDNRINSKFCNNCGAKIEGIVTK